MIDGAGKFDPSFARHPRTLALGWTARQAIKSEIHRLTPFLPAQLSAIDAL
jgi:hypothetical protein